MAGQRRVKPGPLPGWTKVSFGEDHAPLAVLERWIDESYRVITGKK